MSSGRRRNSRRMSVLCTCSLVDPFNLKRNSSMHPTKSSGWEHSAVYGSAISYLVGVVDSGFHILFTSVCRHSVAWLIVLALHNCSQATATLNTKMSTFQQNLFPRVATPTGEATHDMRPCCEIWTMLPLTSPAFLDRPLSELGPPAQLMQRSQHS